MPDPHLKQVSPGHWQVQGKITSTLVLGQSGLYQFAPGAAVEIPVGQSLKMIGIDIRADGVTLEGAVVVAGFRQINVQGKKHTTIRRAKLTRAGVPHSPHGTGGHAIYGDHGSDFVLEDSIIEAPAGHGLYLAETWSSIRIRRTRFHGDGTAHSPLFQLNSEGGQGIFDAEMEDCQFIVDGPKAGNLNLWGAGKAGQAVVFRRCKMQGGAGTVNADQVGGRPSFVVLDGCDVQGAGVAVRAWRGCRIERRGGTKVAGKLVSDGGGVIV
jgi:hypothetical protein